MRCLIFHKIEIMGNYLLGLGFPLPRIRACPYSQDIAGRFHVIKMADLSGGDPAQEAMLLKHADRYDATSELIVSDDDSAYQLKGTAGDILTRFIPVHNDDSRSFDHLMLMCRGQEKFLHALDAIFGLGVANIRSLKVQRGDDELFLIDIPHVTTPILLAKIIFSSNIQVFYPLFSVNCGVWMEWGWKCDFSDPHFYWLFQESDSETVLVEKDGNKISIPAGISDFIPLIRFMNLVYSRKCQTRMAEKREFKTPEFDYKLRLKRDTYRKNRKTEMERLLQEEREIRERIEWLQDIEAVFLEETTFWAFFYPFSEAVKDPIFPQAFIRHHSLSQLRKIKTFHGNMGTLGGGVLVCGKDFIDRASNGAFHISDHLRPRRGMIFQSNPHWLNRAGLRVMTPKGFDLFPYLEVDSDDRKVIVDAFLKHAVWGVKHDPEGAKKTDSEASLNVLAEGIREHPEKHLYFIFPRQDKHYPDWEDCPLEGLIIREEEFRDFEVKMANLGVNFAMEESEREIVGREIRETIVQNVTDSFDGCIAKIRGHIEESFQKERDSIKKEIEKFDKNVENKREKLRKQGESLRKAMVSVEKKEQLIDRYEEFLVDVVKRYTSLFQKGSTDIGHFLRSVQPMLSEASKAFSSILEKCDQQTKEGLKTLEKTHKDMETVAKESFELVSKRTAAFNAIKNLEEFQGKVVSEGVKREWDKLKLKENVQNLWRLDMALLGLESFLVQVENHIREARSVVLFEKTHAAVRNDSSAAVDWLGNIIGRLIELKGQLEREAPEAGSRPLTVSSQMEADSQQCLDTITASIRSIMEWRDWHHGKMDLHGNTLQYIGQLRARLDDLVT